MTGDEWRARGIELAISADEEDGSCEFLRQALKCFTQAGDDALSKKVQTQIESWMLCRQLEELDEDIFACRQLDEDCSPVEEACLVSNVGACIAEGLVKEATDLCRCWLPRTSSRTQYLMETEIMSKLHHGTCVADSL